MAAVSCAPSESANLLLTDQATIQNSLTKRLYRLSNETIVFFTHNTVGYIVMLAVMGYNVQMFLTVVIGMGVGYFFFGHISMKINMESIQARTTNLVCATSCPENGVPSSKFTFGTLRWILENFREETFVTWFFFDNSQRFPWNSTTISSYFVSTHSEPRTITMLPGTEYVQTWSKIRWNNASGSSMLRESINATASLVQYGVKKWKTTARGRRL